MSKNWITNLSFLAAGVAAGSLRGRLPSHNRRIVEEVFEGWSAGRGSLFQLMGDDARIVIPGTAAHCGSFSKRDFIKDVAGPFIARFRKTPVPVPRCIWSQGDDVAVLADAAGTRLDGKPYANRYVFVLTMRGGRVVKATQFLDMSAFNDVWDNVEPASVAQPR